MENLIATIQDFFVTTFAAMSAFAMALLIIGCVFFAFVAVFVFRFYIAYKMAKNRHRDPLTWVLLSFFVSPILTWIILLVVGDAHPN